VPVGKITRATRHILPGSGRGYTLVDIISGQYGTGQAIRSHILYGTTLGNT